MGWPFRIQHKTKSILTRKHAQPIAPIIKGDVSAQVEEDLQELQEI